MFFTATLRADGEALGEKCASALYVTRDDNIIAEALKQHNCLNTDIALIVVGELIGKEEDCPF